MRVTAAMCCLQGMLCVFQAWVYVFLSKNTWICRLMCAHLTTTYQNCHQSHACRYQSIVPGVKDSCLLLPHTGLTKIYSGENIKKIQFVPYEIRSSSVYCTGKYFNTVQKNSSFWNHEKVFGLVTVSIAHVQTKQTPWSESASEPYRPSDRLLSAKWLPTFADKGCHVVSVTDPHGRILGFLDRSRYFSIK
jgi:hypothetical protein